MTRRGIAATLLALAPWTARAADRGDDADAEKKCKREGAEFCRELTVGESACRQQWNECCEKKSAKARRRCVRRVVDDLS